MWPVGLVGGMKYERPVVEGGKVGVFCLLVCELWNSTSTYRLFPELSTASDSLPQQIKFSVVMEITPYPVTHMQDLGHDN